MSFFIFHLSNFILQSAKKINILRAETKALRAGAYYVRTQAMAVKHHIALAQEFDEHDDNPDTKYIVAIDDVLPVATCRLYPLDSNQMMIGRVVVLPEYRGHGLGSKIIGAAEHWAKESGYTTAVLESRENKVAFYEKLGYIEDRDHVIHGDTFTCIAMKKEL